MKKKDKWAAYMRKYRQRRWEKEPWVKTMASIKVRCTANYIGNIKYFKKGIKCEITLDELRKLWERDRAYEMKRPSIDRIDDSKGYTFENCRYLELSENSRLGGLKASSVMERGPGGRFVKKKEK